MTDSRTDDTIYDLAVIGGGINGCGIAADAAGRGLRVLLIERDDLACGTSSASSKLIHGGLRYLEQYAFRLVRESLEEREVLLANAPHIVWPLRFLVPHVPHMRSRIMIRAGLFLYDHLAKRRRIASSSLVDMARDPAARPLSAEFRSGFSYWDCWVDDARLVVSVALQAARHGAHIKTRTALRRASIAEGRWLLEIDSGGQSTKAAAHMLVNAAGPWAGALAHTAIHRGGTTSEVAVRLVKGSHIVVPRIEGAECAYLLQADDRRVVFLLPFADRFTLIGTTDVPFDGDPATAAISAAEADYLLHVANAFLASPLQHADIVWSYAGVRPLYDDASENPSAVTRDYKLALEVSADAPPLLTVVGGKVTTYRRLAQSALEALAPFAGAALGPDWTANAALPGGDMPDGDFDAFLRALQSQHPTLPADLLRQLGRRYGTRARLVIGDAKSIGDLGADLGGGLSEREVVYLRDHEWARQPEDVLWRRTKAGLGMASQEMASVQARIARVLGS